MMLWNLMKSYVDAINQGAIPSIESSWAYICKNECLKALEDSFEVFMKNMMDEVNNGGSFFDNELKEIYSTAKKYAIEHFNKVAVGDVRENFMKDLRDKMKNKFKQI